MGPRKFSSESLTEFLSATLEALPSSSELREILEEFADDHASLISENEGPCSSRPGTKALTSEFEIESRRGMRATKVSQKLRQEKDRANMTSADTKYTTLLENLNEILKEVLS